MSFSVARLLPGVAAVLGAAALVVAGPAAAHGASLHTWTGNGDHHSWTDAGNWDDGVPQDGDSVVIESHQGGCATDVDGVPTITLQDLTVTNGDGCGVTVADGAITVDGTFSWDEGTLETPVTLAAGSTGTISGAGTNFGKALRADLTVAGTLTMSGATMTIWAPNVLHVTAGAALHTTGGNDVEFSACCVDPARITNDGTLSVDDGTLTVDAVALDQHGLLSVADGATATLTGPGRLGPGSYSGGGRLILAAGQSAQLAGRNTLGPGFHLELAGGTLAGKGGIAGRGSFDWSAGTLAAATTVQHGGTMHVYGAVTHGLSAAIIDHGTITVDGQAAVQMSGPTTLTVADDGVLSTAPGTSYTTISCCANPNRIVNSGGSVIVPAASGGVTPGTPASVSGNAYSATGGTTSVAPGEVLDLTGGAAGALQDTTVTGGGTVSVTTPTTVAGTVTVDSGTDLALGASGSLTGSGTIAGPGELDWTGGTFGGTPTVAVGAGLRASGPAAKSVAQNGTLTVTGPMDVASGTSGSPTLISMGFFPSRLRTVATTTVGHDVTMHGGTWTNDGTLTVDAGDGGADTFDQNAEIINNGTTQLASGAMSVSGGYQQAAGSSEVASGATLTAPLAVTGGTLAGDGTIVGAVQNAGGTVSPGRAQVDGSRGTLTITGSYVQGPGGRLAVDLAGPGAAQHDLLAVSGAADLAGMLTSTSRAGYAPPAGTSLSVLTRGSGSGSFECAFSVKLPGARWLPGYTSTAVAVAPGAAGPSGCLAYQPEAPVRAPTMVSVTSGHVTNVDLRGIAGVTASTAAVTVNLSVENASAVGTLHASAAGVSSTATAVRFQPDLPASGQATLALHNGRLQLQTSNGSADVHVDVLGVFVDGQGGSGALLHVQQPAALPIAPVTSGSDVDLPVAGRAGVPLHGATAVTATVTVRSATADGALAVLPGGGSYDGTESVPVQDLQNTSNLVTTALDASGRLRLHLSAGTARVTVTVLGWYGTDGSGSWTVPVTPNLVNTSTLSGNEVDPGVVGVGGVPSVGATSVLVSADVTAESARTELEVGGRSATLWPAVEVPRTGGGAAPAQIVPGLYNEAAERLSNGSATVALAIFGYTVG